MGYVPGRRYEKCMATLGPNGMDIVLSTDAETRYYLQYLWLREEKHLSYCGHWDETTHGTLTISSELVRTERKYQFENVEVMINAQGSTSVSCKLKDSMSDERTQRLFREFAQAERRTGYVHVSFYHEHGTYHFDAL